MLLHFFSEKYQCFGDKKIKSFNESLIKDVVTD